MYIFDQKKKKNEKIQQGPDTEPKRCILFAKASSEMVSVEGWLSRSHSQGRKWREKAEVCQMTQELD